MTRSNTATFILLIAVLATPGVAQTMDPVEELKTCAQVPDAAARLACFDDLGERVLRDAPTDEDSSPEETAQPAAGTPVAAAQALPEDLGRASTAEYVGLVTSCRQGGRGDWYFFFDNGQVWKQVNSGGRRFKECNFDATITKDGFGFKMRIESLDRTIRVKRHR